MRGRASFPVSHTLWDMFSIKMQRRIDFHRPVIKPNREARSGALSLIGGRIITLLTQKVLA